MRPEIVETKCIKTRPINQCGSMTSTISLEFHRCITVLPFTLGRPWGKQATITAINQS
jgi:hypothetical protein